MSFFDQKLKEKPAKDAADGKPPPAVADAAVPGKFSMCRALTSGATDEWCVHSCAAGNCPKTTCTCDAEEEGAEDAVGASSLEAERELVHYCWPRRAKKGSAVG